MAKIYEKSTYELMLGYFKEINLQKGQEVKKQDINNWFKKNYPKIKNNTIYCHLLKFSINAPSRKHYNVHDDGRDDILFQIDGNTFRLYDKTIDVVVAPPDTVPPDEDISSQEFVYEKDLQNFLIKNLSVIEQGLKLYEEDGITGKEYPVDGRYIDILALDKNDNFVVIELKVSRGYDRVVGQLLRYKNWIKMNLAEKEQNVRGIIICKEITDDLVLACMGQNDIELYEYELSIKLNKKIL